MEKSSSLQELSTKLRLPILKSFDEEHNLL